MKRTIAFFMILWTCFMTTHAQNFVVYSAANTVKLVNGKTMYPIRQGQKLSIKSRVNFLANATLDLINIDNQKRYILNAKKGFYSIEKLVSEANGIELSMAYLRYLMKQLLAGTSTNKGDGEGIGGSYRGQDMFDIQEWLDNDSIEHTETPDININNNQ